MKSSNNRTSRPKMMILSVIAAIVVWAGIIYINPPELTTTITNLPVRLSGEEQLRERGLTVVGKTEISGLAVTVKGNRDDLLNLSRDVYVDVDVSSIASSGEFDVNGNVTVPSSRITIEDVKFDAVPITVDTIESKEINIEIAQTGTVVGKLIKSSSDTSAVTITGAKSELDEVSYGLITVDVGGMTEDAEGDYNYVLMNSDSSLITKNETIESSVTHCLVKSVIYNEVTVPVDIEITEELKKEYALDESASSVSPATVVVGVKDTASAPASMKVVISKAEEEVQAEIESVDGVYIPETEKKVRVRPVLDKKISKTIKVKPTAQNVPEGLTAEAEQISVSAFGTEAELTAGNVTAYADLALYTEAGTYSVPVTVQSDTLELEGSYTANITLTATGS